MKRTFFGEPIKTPEMDSRTVALGGVFTGLLMLISAPLWGRFETWGAALAGALSAGVAIGLARYIARRRGWYSGSSDTAQD